MITSPHQMKTGQFNTLIPIRKAAHNTIEQKAEYTSATRFKTRARRQSGKPDINIFQERISALERKVNEENNQQQHTPALPLSDPVLDNLQILKFGRYYS